MALQIAHLPRFAGESVPVGRRPALYQERHRHDEFPRGRGTQSCRFLGGSGIVLWARQQGRTRLRQQMPHIQLCPEDVEIFRPTEQRFRPTEQRFRLSEVKTLHPEQKRAVDEIADLFKVENEVTLQGVTGSGKTLVASNVISRLQPKAVLIMVPVKALATQLQRSFEVDFVDTHSHIFVSHSCGYSASEVIEINGTLKVKKGKRIVDEEIKGARLETIMSVDRGDHCIITSSTCALFGGSPALMNREVEVALTPQEIDCIVRDLQGEVNILRGQKREALIRRIETDMELIETHGKCPDMWELYQDLLPKRFKCTLIDKMNESFGKDWLLIVDECHSTVPAMKGLHPAYQTRVSKQVARGHMRENLLNSLRQSGPLSWEALQECSPDKVLWMSATPHPQACPTVFLEIRPTHICDPVIELITTEKKRKEESEPRYRSQHDSESLLTEVRKILRKRRPEDQALVATIECNLADVLQAFINVDHRCGVVHGEQTGEQKVEVLTKFRNGELDVLCGSKMLIEGLDLPGVAMVIVVDADNRGFLRTGAVLTQLVGRAARHASGRAFFLVTEDQGRNVTVDKCIQEHSERRICQERYNEKYGKRAQSIEWAPRLERMSRAKVDDDASPAAPSDQSGSQDVEAYSGKKCLNILANLVRNSWTEEPDESEDWCEDAESREKPPQNWTTPTTLAEFEEYYFTSEEPDKMLQQLVLMVTIPAIGPVRSYHLLKTYEQIDNIVRQTPTALMKVVQIRQVLSNRLLLPRNRQLLQSNRRKLTMILRLKEFTRQVYELFPESGKALKKQVSSLIGDEEHGFVRELVYRLVVLCKRHAASDASFLDGQNS